MNGNLILLKDYCIAHGKTSQCGIQRAKMGSFNTAVKIGRQWFIDADEEWVDNRVTSGKYIGWRKPKDK